MQRPSASTSSLLTRWGLRPWHLTEVQAFWHHIIRHRPAGPETYAEPTRPADESLADGLRHTCHALVDALAAADHADSAWSWAAEQTVGFTVRRQCHEALVHHVDAALAVGADLPEGSPQLFADGVDELVTVMLCELNDWATFERGSGALRLDASDVGDTWTMRFGRVRGYWPERDENVDIASVELAPDADPDAVISAPARELDLWMWGRAPDSVLEVNGDGATVERLRSVLAGST